MSFLPPWPEPLLIWTGHHEKGYRLSVMDVDPIRRIFYVDYMPAGARGKGIQITEPRHGHPTDSDVSSIWEWAWAAANQHADKLQFTE